MREIPIDIIDFIILVPLQKKSRKKKPLLREKERQA
jgi:hypothetical protein